MNKIAEKQLNTFNELESQLSNIFAEFETATSDQLSDLVNQIIVIVNDLVSTSNAFRDQLLVKINQTISQITLADNNIT